MICINRFVINLKLLNPYFTMVEQLKYKTQFLGPLFTGVGGLMVGFGADIITLDQTLNGITAVSTLMIAIMMYKWADV